jgi:hypothetical protein
MGDFLNERGIRAIWDPMVDMIRQEFPYHKQAVNGWINYDNELKGARNWLAARTAYFIYQLASFYNEGTPTVLTVNKDVDSDKLADVTISINDIPLTQPVFDGKYYAGRQVTLRAEGGQQPVVGWSIVQVDNNNSTSTTEIDGAQHIFTMPSCKSLTINALFNTSGIRTITTDDRPASDWYRLDGRRLQGRPTHPGLYIHQGRKVVVE